MNVAVPPSSTATLDGAGEKVTVCESIQYSRTEIRTIVKKVMVNSFEAFKSSREV
jgi:hypothetical protein